MIETIEGVVLNAIAAFVVARERFAVCVLMGMEIVTLEVGTTLERVRLAKWMQADQPRVSGIIRDVGSTHESH